MSLMYFVCLPISGLHKILLLYTRKKLKFFCNVDAKKLKEKIQSYEEKIIEYFKNTCTYYFENPQLFICLITAFLPRT